MEKILQGWFAPNVPCSFGKLNNLDFNTETQDWKLTPWALLIPKQEGCSIMKKRNIHKDADTLLEYQVLCEISYLAFCTLLKDTSVYFIASSSARAERGQLSLKRWISVSC